MVEPEAPEQASSLAVLTVTGHSAYDQLCKRGTIKQTVVQEKGQQERVTGLPFTF